MEQTLTLKVRLKPNSQQAQQFHDVSIVYRDACNVVSQWYFDQYFKVNRKDFNQDMYHPLKKRFPGLNTAMVQSTYRTVLARYKTVETQLENNPLYVPTGKYDKHGKEIWKPIQRDLNWLYKPILFSRPQADYVRGMNYTFVKHASEISMNVLHQRIKVSFNHYFDKILLSKSVRLGTAKLVEACNHWYFHISVTFQIPDKLKMSDVTNVVGIDRGLRFLVTTYDSKHQTGFVSGQEVLRKRRHYKKLRAELQKRQTSSARQRLKKIGKRENRWMSDVNHCITKTLVNKYGSKTLFVLEDLTGIKKTVKHRKKQNRYEQDSWAFYQLETDLIYKALRTGSNVVKVPANYTSQRCPMCGRINKGNRNHDLHLYKCDRCGYSSNDDRIGAMNIYLLGLLVRNGVKNVKFKKN